MRVSSRRALSLQVSRKLTNPAKAHADEASQGRMGHLIVLAHPQDRHDVVSISTSFPLQLAHDILHALRQGLLV